MKEHNVDAEKICKHIKYTKHWLDKANQELQDQKFASGSVVLNLARAELTAAWEEMMQIRTQVFKTIPRKAKANWKPLASASLLASGFIMAIIVTRFTDTPLTSSTTIEDTRPAVTSPLQAIITPAPILTAAVAAQPSTSRGTYAENAKRKQRRIVKQTASYVPASQPQARASSVQPIAAPVETRLAPRQEAAAPETKRIEEPVSLPYSPVGSAAQHVSAQSHAERKSSELKQNDVIELFKTAEQTLTK